MNEQKYITNSTLFRFLLEEGVVYNDVLNWSRVDVDHVFSNFTFSVRKEVWLFTQNEQVCYVLVST